MRTAILIIGSLLWDTNDQRKSWRESRLDIERAMPVGAPIRYSRLSESRGKTFTMTFKKRGLLGQAVLVPCRKESLTVRDLISEAEELWKAEDSNARRGGIGASWGCVGARFREPVAQRDWIRSWSKHFRDLGVTAIQPINGKGLLPIPWPTILDNEIADIDVILATATKATRPLPTPTRVADAWVDQHDGHENYFFENVRHGIWTPEDKSIWKRIEKRVPSWINDPAYANAIRTLRKKSQ